MNERAKDVESLDILAETKTAYSRLIVALTRVRAYDSGASAEVRTTQMRANHHRATG